MKIEWSINKDKHYVHLKYYGQPDFDYWTNIMENIFAHPDYIQGMGFIANLTESDAPDANHLRAVKDFIISHKTQMEGIRWANVTARRTVHFGMTRMAQVFVENLPNELNAFLSEKEALEWVTASDKKKIPK